MKHQTLAPKVNSRTGAHALWEAMVSEGVKVVFGYPGGAIMPAYDALVQYPIHHVLVRHEQGAAHMADGYARASGEVGVAIATSGPGATNLVTGIATAMLDSVPIVCITGQVPSSLLGTNAFQEVNIVGVTAPITKHNFLVQRAEDVGPAVHEAFRIARSGRKGPVLVDITKDAQLGPCQHLELRQRPSEATMTSASRDVTARGSASHDEALRERIERSMELIARATRPVVIAGHGIIHAEASGLLRRFAELTQMPVASTLLGLGGFPHGHPLALGMLGMHGEPWVNRAVQEADLLVALGMRFDDRVTLDVRTFAPRAKKIHVDIDAAELGKNVPVDVAICSCVAPVLRSFVATASACDRGSWHQRIAGMRKEAKLRCVQNEEGTERLRAPHVIHDICRLTQGKAVVVTDVGQHQMWEAQYYAHEEPRSLITSGGLGTMGFALPAAIGARFARPGAEIWVIVGDGGFQMSAAELATLVQENVKVNIALINNGHLGMVRQQQQLFYEQRYVATPLSSPDFVKLAEAHGLPALRVERRVQVEWAVQRARASASSFLIEFCVAPHDLVYPTIPSGGSLDEMLERPWQKPLQGGR